MTAGRISIRTKYQRARFACILATVLAERASNPDLAAVLGLIANTLSAPMPEVQARINGLAPQSKWVRIAIEQFNEQQGQAPTLFAGGGE